MRRASSFAKAGAVCDHRNGQSTEAPAVTGHECGDSEERSDSVSEFQPTTLPKRQSSVFRRTPSFLLG